MDLDNDIYCSICIDVPSIPVIVNLFSCKCKDLHRYCLTCVRDCFNLNGNENGAGDHHLKQCPLCRAPFTIPAHVFGTSHLRNQNKINWNKVYTVDEGIMDILDTKYGDTKCPRDCVWTGKRKDARHHLTQCPNTFRYKCKGCYKLMTENGLKEHIEPSDIDNSIKITKCTRQYYYPCDHCKKWLLKPLILMAHEKDCSHDGYYCRYCRVKFETEKEILEHLKKPKYGTNRCLQLYVCCKHCGDGTFMTRSDSKVNLLIEKNHQSVCSSYETCEICNNRFMKGKHFGNHHLDCSRAEIEKLKRHIESLMHGVDLIYK